MNVLILNCFSRNALATIGSVDPSYVLYGGCSLSSPLRLKVCGVLKSKRIEKLLYVSRPTVDPEGFKSDVISHVRKYGIDLVIPTGTVETDCLSLYKDEIEAATGVRLAVERYVKHQRVTDKGMTIELCDQLGIPVPPSWKIKEMKEGRRLLDANKLVFPLVMKPTRSFASEGVRFFDTPACLRQFIDSEGGRSATGGPWLIQQRIEGELHDVTSCSKAGNPLMMLSQQRLMTWYDFGGGGIANVTTDEPSLKEYATRIISELGWNGILEFDFIRSTNGRCYLLECNPKIWGTTQLTVDAGLNMPQCAVEVFTGGSVEGVCDYQVGLKYMWLFPYCLASILNKPRSASAIVARVSKIVRTLPGSKINVTMDNLTHLLGTVVSRVHL